MATPPADDLIALPLQEVTPEPAPVSPTQTEALRPETEPVTASVSELLPPDETIFETPPSPEPVRVEEERPVYPEQSAAPERPVEIASTAAEELPAEPAPDTRVPTWQMPPIELPSDLVLIETQPEKLAQVMDQPAEVSQAPKPRRTRPPEQPVPDEPLVQIETRGDEPAQRESA
jgi:hypothetical protein